MYRHEEHLTEPTKREALFTMRMSKDEFARLRRVAAHYGLSLTGVVRMLITMNDPGAASPVSAAKTTNSSKKLAKTATTKKAKKS